MKILKLFEKTVMAAILLGFASISIADQLMVTRGFNGVWGQTGGQSQGVNLQVVHRNDNSRVAIVYWYTYGQDNMPTWYLGLGDINGNQIDFELYVSDNVGFMQNQVPDFEPVNTIGTMNMSFSDCQAGMVSFDTTHPEVGAGSFAIHRVTSTLNTQCTGGLADDHDNMMRGSEQVIQLASTVGNANASGHARFIDSAGYSMFDVQIEGVDDGTYNLFMGAHDYGEFTVMSGFGQYEFTSPQESGKMHLTFDPRGMQISIHDGVGEIMNSQGNMFEYGDNSNNQHDYACEGEGGNHNNGNPGHDGGNSGGDCMEDGEYTQLRVNMNNAGYIASARGAAEWEISSAHIGFEVEIEGIPEGEYSLRVAGQLVGTIIATQMHAEVVGYIMFRDPQVGMANHLNFDPRGKVVKVMQGSNVILKVNFPVQ